MKKNKISPYKKGIKEANADITKNKLPIIRVKELHELNDIKQYSHLVYAQNKTIPKEKRKTAYKNHEYYKGKAMAYGMYSTTGSKLRY